MARIQTSSIISNITGSIGGVTFSNTRSGLSAKKRLVGRKSIGSKQLTALNKGKQVIAAWTELSYGQKQAWNDYSSLYTFTDRFGNTKALTGMNWYMTVNTTRAFYELAATVNPPTYEVPAALPIFYLIMSATSIAVQWAEPINTATLDIQVFASLPSRSQAVYNRGQYKLLNIGAVDYSDTFDITAAWEYATGLNYAETAGTGNVNINCLIIPVSKLSYITGLGQTGTSQVPRIGIGAMQIGSTFVVS